MKDLGATKKILGMEIQLDCQAQKLIVSQKMDCQAQKLIVFQKNYIKRVL